MVAFVIDRLRNRQTDVVSHTIKSFKCFILAIQALRSLLSTTSTTRTACGWKWLVRKMLGSCLVEIFIRSCSSL